MDIHWKIGDLNAIAIALSSYFWFGARKSIFCHRKTSVVSRRMDADDYE